MFGPPPIDGSTDPPDLRRVVIVFAHAPKNERRVKPFHAGSHTPAQHAAAVERLHRLLLRRAIHAAASIADAEVRLVVNGDVGQAGALAAGLVPSARLRVVQQDGATFGARLFRAVEQAFADEAQHVVVIGSDTPECDGRRLREAFDALEAGCSDSPCAVVGPATDGGYYLLGLSRYTAAPFQRMPFGSARVAALTLLTLHAAGYQVHTLPPLQDLDDADDVRALTCRLRGSPGAADRVLLRAALAVVDQGPGELLPERAPAPPLDLLTRLLPRGPPASA